ncbi:hypothetical protein AG1IA_04152 [Rhizoctonia solani AG-1 IA]|uniref:Uncharacterized protein n=1 Tax=Thanatephorus cucumeris (strain AG1-IA) TaxID=983506 RepID=L8WYE8_THACA|nr:hypothetical protein AG1IA_04152 [Rhizoctonia solani AG-1 IA]
MDTVGGKLADNGSPLLGSVEDGCSHSTSKIMKYFSYSWSVITTSSAPSKPATKPTSPVPIAPEPNSITRCPAREPLLARYRDKT